VYDQPTAEPLGQDRGPALPDQVTMGLLAYLTAHAVDEDYAEVASRAPAGDAPRSRRPIGAAGAVALAIFAVLAVTAAVQTSRDSGDQERDRAALIEQVKARKAALATKREAVDKLQAEVNSLETELLRNSHDSSGILEQLNLLRLRSGTSPVRGPGVEIVVDDAKDAETDRERVLDIDLQKIVNGLWRAGAEAISINGERLTARSAIRHAAQGITVNFHGVRRPYRILAIGNKLTMPSRFVDTASGQAWLDSQREVGLRFSIRTESSLRLPAADLPTFRYAEPTERTQGKRSS
jgi:uncharacterized protein YlxW (UPF0749 family)